MTFCSKGDWGSNQICQVCSRTRHSVVLLVVVDLEQLRGRKKNLRQWHMHCSDLLSFHKNTKWLGETHLAQDLCCTVHRHYIISYVSGSYSGVHET